MLRQTEEDPLAPSCTPWGHRMTQHTLPLHDIIPQGGAKRHAEGWVEQKGITGCIAPNSKNLNTLVFPDLKTQNHSSSQSPRQLWWFFSNVRQQGLLSTTSKAFIPERGWCPLAAGSCRRNLVRCFPLRRMFTSLCAHWQLEAAAAIELNTPHTRGILTSAHEKNNHQKARWVESKKYTCRFSISSLCSLFRCKIAAWYSGRSQEKPVTKEHEMSQKPQGRITWIPAGSHPPNSQRKDVPSRVDRKESCLTSCPDGQDWGERGFLPFSTA